MASTLFICLFFAATITVGVQQFQNSNGGDQAFCMNRNAQGGLLAYQNCSLACNGMEPAANVMAADGTPCMYTSEGGNSIDGSSGPDGMQRGTCKNNACIKATPANPTTREANAGASGAATSPAASHNATTMPSNNGSSRASSEAMQSTASHSAGTTATANMTTWSGSYPTIINVSGRLTTSHNGTTVHANPTTTKKPSSAASPSRLLGNGNQGAIITVLALAVLGRSP